MGGVEVDLQHDSRRNSPAEESVCNLCKHPLREPLSGSCRHPSCKSCLAVIFTRDLPAISKVLCPTCHGPLKLSELKPDQISQRKLQKFKNCKCRNCNWKGTYSEYIQNHERVCGGIARIQCKVFGCGKWLPKDKVLDVHRSDDWCPMILLMRARLSHAEIVHLSMRESWDWTCGLVLRSEKPSVRTLIERLVQVFSVLDPKVPVALENDEYAATKQKDATGHGSSDPCDMSSKTDSNQVENGNTKSTLSFLTKSSDSIVGKDGDDEPDGHSGATSAVSSDESLLQFNEEEQSRVQYSEERGKLHVLSRDMKQLHHRIQKVESDLVKTAKDYNGNKRYLEDLKNVPRAFAALNERQTVLEGVLGTFNNEVIAMNTKIDNFQVPSMLADTGILEKLVKANQDITRSISALAESIKKVETRLLEVEASHSGIFLWKISYHSQKKREAATTNIKSIYSPPFFTSQYGYKLCGRVFLIGDGVGKGTHISLFLTIMKGPHDAVLPWPFKEKITFQLVNQEDPRNQSIVEAFRPDPASSSFKRPTSERNIGAGCPLFAKIQVIEDPKKGFVKDDTLFLKIISQTCDLPEIK